MAFAEPLAVAIHAAHEAGDLQGKRIFISGVGPIGCLIVSAVKTLGAAEVVCADIGTRSLSLARQMGADTLVNPQHDSLDDWKAEKGISISVLKSLGILPLSQRVWKSHGPKA